MLELLGKKIVLLAFKGIIDIKKNEEVNFDKWKGEITKRHAAVKSTILDYFDVT